VKKRNIFSRGKDEEFRQIFETFYPRLFRFAAEYTGSTQDAEDILQNVFLIFWQKRASLPLDTNLIAYLLTMVKNHCINHLKHQQVVLRYATNHQIELQRELEFNGYAFNYFNPEEMDIESLERLAEKAIDDLPKQCRKVFELSRYDGLKYREIAEKLGISIKTVEAHMSYALKKLRMSLQVG